jgi:hypothetical protein
VHIFITRGKKLSIITSKQETFTYVRLTFSTICKNNSSMHSELIIQVKYMRALTYLRRDQPAINSQKKTFPFFFFQHHVYDMAQTPMACRRDSNLLPSRGLVRMSANWFSVGMNARETTTDSKRSRKK